MAIGFIYPDFTPTHYSSICLMLCPLLIMRCTTHLWCSPHLLSTLAAYIHLTMFSASHQHVPSLYDERAVWSLCLDFLTGTCVMKVLSMPGEFLCIWLLCPSSMVSVSLVMIGISSCVPFLAISDSACNRICCVHTIFSPVPISICPALVF